MSTLRGCPGVAVMHDKIFVTGGRGVKGKRGEHLTLIFCIRLVQSSVSEQCGIV